MSLFIQNKYTKWYYNIINDAISKSRQKDNTHYYESHHIIPKCMNGTNDKSNLVLLVAKEHYIVHLLLPKMTNGVIKSKMAYAYYRMQNNPNGNKSRYSSKSYEIHRKSISDIIKKNPSGGVKCIINDIKFASKRGAAEYFNVTINVINYKTKHKLSTIDEYNEDPSTNQHNGLPKDVIMNGKCYNSMSAAARDLNTTLYKIKAAVAQNVSTLEEYKIPSHTNSKPCIIDGIKYKSKGEAEKKSGYGIRKLNKIYKNMKNVKYYISLLMLS